MSDLSRPKLFATVVVLVGSLFIVGYLVSAMKRYNQPPGVSAQRTAERYKNLSETASAAKEAATQYGWVDQGKGFVRIPLERAREIILREYQNPAQAKALLVERADKLNAAAPPPPNDFE